MVWDVCLFPPSGPGLCCPIFTPVEIAGCSLKVFLCTLWVWAADRIDTNSCAHCLPNSLFINVCGLALWSVYRYFNFLLTCSVEDLISSCISFFSWAACGQVFLSDHLVAIHLSGGLRKELISLVSLAIYVFFDGKLPLSPLKILTTDEDVGPSGYLPGFPSFVQWQLLLWFCFPGLSFCKVLNILDILLHLYLPTHCPQ